MDVPIGLTTDIHDFIESPTALPKVGHTQKFERQTPCQKKRRLASHARHAILAVSGSALGVPRLGVGRTLAPENIARHSRRNLSFFLT
jgi:hypothetical protein